MESFVTNLDIEKSAQKIMSALQTATETIRQLQEENNKLQEIKNLSTIHLAQFRRDYEKLVETYKKYNDFLNFGVPIKQFGSFPQPQQMLIPSVQSLMSNQPISMPMQSILLQNPIPQQQYMESMQPRFASDLQPPPPVPTSPLENVVSSPSKQHSRQHISSPPSTSPTISSNKKVKSESPIQQNSGIHGSHRDSHDDNEYRDHYVHGSMKKSQQQTIPIYQEESFLNFVTPTPEIKSHDPFYTDEHLHLKYALSTDAVVCSIAFSPDGTKFVFANTKTAFICNSNNGEVITKVNMCFEPSIKEFNPRCIRFSPDGQKIFLGNDDCNILIFDANTGAHIHTLKQHTKKISSLLFLNNGEILVSAGYDRLICIWNLTDFSLIKKLDHPSKEGEQEDMIVGLDYANKDGESFIAVGFMNGYVGIYDVKFEQPILLFKAHDQNLMNLKISPFDCSIATGSQDSTAKIWVLQHSPTHQTTLTGHQNMVLALAFKPNGPMLITGSKDETICGWDYKESTMLFQIIAHKNTIFEIAHHPTENAFISCSGEGLVCYWTYDNKP